MKSSTVLAFCILAAAHIYKRELLGLDGVSDLSGLGSLSFNHDSNIGGGGGGESSTAYAYLSVCVPRLMFVWTSVLAMMLRMRSCPGDEPRVRNGI